MSLSPPPISTPFDADGRPSWGWIKWSMEVYRAARGNLGTGTTAERPINGMQTGDWYFDTTLGNPIWYSGSGWVDATGAGV